MLSAGGGGIFEEAIFQIGRKVNVGCGEVLSLLQPGPGCKHADNTKRLYLTRSAPVSKSPVKVRVSTKLHTIMIRGQWSRCCAFN